MILHYDLETTGFINRQVALSDPTQARIVQLAAILDDLDGNEIMRLDVIIAVARGVPPKAAAIHGITTEVSQRVGLNESRAIELFLDMLEVADVVVGQNIVLFDNDLIIGAARRVTADETLNPFEGKNIFDTMVAGAPICRLPWKGSGFKKPNLMELHRHFFHEDFAKAHSAISDVLAVRRVFYAMQDRVKAPRESHEMVLQ